MAKMKRRKARSTVGRAPVVRRRPTHAKPNAGTPSARPRLRKVTKGSTRAKSSTVGTAAMRVVVSTARTAQAFAKVGAVHLERTGRKLVARGTRAAAAGVQKGARSAGDFTASTLRQMAERVESSEIKGRKRARG